MKVLTNHSKHFMMMEVCYWAVVVQTESLGFWGDNGGLLEIAVTC